MQIILPTIWEDATRVEKNIPASLQHILWPGTEHVLYIGPWGHLLTQTISRKDYTLSIYHADIKEASFPVHVRGSRDEYHLMIVCEGNLHGSYRIEGLQGRLVHYRGLVRVQWEFQKGAATLLQVRTPKPPVEAAGTVYLSRLASQQLHELPDILHTQVAPELYIDGLVALLLKEYAMSAKQSEDNHYLQNPPFHFLAADLAKVYKAKAILDASFATRPTLLELARQAGTNTDLLKKGFKHRYGQTIHQYWLEISLQYAKELILTTNKTVKEVAAAAGFVDYPHFIQRFKKKWGSTPAQLRKTI